mmetsp:Transcript_74228/g.174282  ORF Transcript_74228/g.174282 Transcript_74228/m.174282 type:complete len:246 (+) Transcript_74228:3-740(+)
MAWCATVERACADSPPDAFSLLMARFMSFVGTVAGISLASLATLNKRISPCDHDEVARRFEAVLSERGRRLHHEQWESMVKRGCYSAKCRDPYQGYQLKPSDLNLRAETLIVDVGGEGPYTRADGRKFGHEKAINLNCSAKVSSMEAGSSVTIQNRVYGFAENLPFVSNSVDEVIVENAPVFVNELKRVAKPGGKVRLAGPCDAFWRALEELTQEFGSPAVFQRHKASYGSECEAEFRVPRIKGN